MTALRQTAPFPSVASTTGIVGAAEALPYRVRVGDDRIRRWPKGSACSTPHSQAARKTRREYDGPEQARYPVPQRRHARGDAGGDKDPIPLPQRHLLLQCLLQTGRCHLGAVRYPASQASARAHLDRTGCEGTLFAGEGGALQGTRRPAGDRPRSARFLVTSTPDAPQNRSNLPSLSHSARDERSSATGSQRSKRIQWVALGTWISLGFTPAAGWVNPQDQPNVTVRRLIAVGTPG